MDDDKWRLLRILIIIAIFIIIFLYKNRDRDQKSFRSMGTRKDNEPRFFDDAIKSHEIGDKENLADEVRRKIDMLNQGRTQLPDHLERERQTYLNRPIPPKIRQEMRNFLAGIFTGADRSPLAYVGYHAGMSGLSESARAERLEICFRIEIPKELDLKYVAWGAPASRKRLEAMARHLRMLSDMFRTRPNYEVAVAEWEEDIVWLLTNLNPIVAKFSANATKRRTRARM